MYLKKPMQKLNKYWFSITLFAAFVFRLTLSFFAHHIDLFNHADWGVRFWQYGPTKFYTANVWSFTWPNQPPGTIYIFAGIRKLYEGIFSFFSYLHFQLNIFPGSILLYLEKNLYTAFVKLPAILADFGIAWLIYKIVFGITKKKNLSALGSIVWLFNPVVWYNSSVWGQYDAVINFLAMLAFYLLTRRKLIFALMFLAVSFYIKASLLIFAPIFLIVALRQKYDIKSWLLALGASLLTITLFTIPFSGGKPFIWLYYLYKDKVFTEQLHVVTANGFNFWGMVFGVKDSAVQLSDSARFLGIWAYKYISYIIYLIFYLLPTWLVFKKQDIKSVFWALAIVSFSSFILLTNMHERYLYPIFPYFTVLVVMTPTLFANYAGVSLVNLLNLYYYWWVPVIPGLMNFMVAKDGLAARVLSGINVLLFLFLYLRFIRYSFDKKKL
jgi:Gpi18-like mannosyltransferase